MHEAAGVGERNKARVDNQERYVAGRLRKQEIADAHQRHRDQHHRTGAVAMKHVADDRTFDGAFGAREGKREGGRGPAKIQLLAERQKKTVKP